MLKVLISREIFGTGKTAPWNSPKSWVKNTFSAEKSRGEGITRRERGVRYWNVRVWGGRPSPFGLKMAEKLKTLEKCCFWVEQRHKKLKIGGVQNWGYSAPFETIFGPFESYWWNAEFLATGTGQPPPKTQKQQQQSSYTSSDFKVLISRDNLYNARTTIWFEGVSW